MSPRRARTARDAWMGPVGRARLLCRFGCVAPDVGALRYTQAVRSFVRRSREIPTPGMETAAELVALLAGPPEGAKNLPPLPTAGPINGPEWVWRAYHQGGGGEPTPEVLAARIALYAVGVLDLRDVVAEDGGFLPVLEPALDLNADPGEDAEVVR